MPPKPYPTYRPSGIDWLGDVPVHWEVKKLKYVTQSIEQGWSPQCDTRPAREDEWGVLKVGCVNGVAFDPLHNKALPSDLLPIEQYEIQPGDLLMSRANTKELVGSVSLIGEVRRKLLLCDKLYRLNLAAEIQPRFAELALKSRAAREQIESGASGASSSMQNISQEVVANLVIPYPPLPEQQAIAAYLDEKTARLDQLLAAKQRLMALLREEKAALIQQAVTQGLDAHAPRKPSSIEWLGEVPAHWEVKKLKHVVSKIGSGVTPTGGASVYQIEGILLLRSQNIYSDGLRLEEAAFISSEIDESMKNSRVQAGDVLLNITGASIGRCFFADDTLGRANVNQHVCIIRPIPEMISTEFLHLVLVSESGQLQIDVLQNGANREGLNFEQLGSFSIPLPPLDEQHEIVAQWKKTQDQIDTTLARISRELELLAEYRTALISEVVTGKLDVRAARVVALPVAEAPFALAAEAEAPTYGTGRQLSFF